MLRIVTLVENSPGEHKGLAYEHGLCFHIETGDNSLLFDVGQSDAAVRNAAKLRIDLQAVRSVVLSHGHYDHSGGLRALAATTTRFELVTGSGFFEAKYGERNGAYEYLGNDFDADWLGDAGIALATLDAPVRKLAPGIHAITRFPRVHPDEIVNPRFKVRVNGALLSDTFADEVMLTVDTPKGVVAMLGCAHPGVKNMLDAASTRLDRPIYAVIGGTHLVEASHDSLQLTLQYLQQKNIAVIGASHCTGAEGMGCLTTAFGDRYFHNRTGSTLFLE